MYFVGICLASFISTCIMKFPLKVADHNSQNHGKISLIIAIIMNSVGTFYSVYLKTIMVLHEL